ncbi:MAG: hypothetical protein ACE15B_22230 [Bryobacteraceae bacterium]
MDCHISIRVRGECDNCGQVPVRLHMPMEMHGWYCEQCCPVCKQAAKANQKQEPRPAAEPQPVAA